MPSPTYLYSSLKIMVMTSVTKMTRLHLYSLLIFACRGSTSYRNLIWCSSSGIRQDSWTAFKICVELSFAESKLLPIFVHNKHTSSRTTFKALHKSTELSGAIDKSVLIFRVNVSRLVLRLAILSGCGRSWIQCKSVILVCSHWDAMLGLVSWSRTLSKWFPARQCCTLFIYQSWVGQSLLT
jgi:hypothetical protein